MYTWIVLLHTTIAIVIVLVILLQVGKGSGMGAAFGGSSESFFGSSGPSNFLEKATIVAGIIFIVTSITLTYLSSENRKNILFNQGVPAQTSTTPAPQQPGLPESLPTGQK